MFARKVSMHLKGSVPDFTQTLEREVIPLLRKQKGFLDEITFVAPGGKEAFGISLWDQAENAESYNRGLPQDRRSCSGLKPIGLFAWGAGQVRPPLE